MSIDFDGVDQSILLGSNDGTLQNVAGATVMAWVRMGSGPPLDTNERICGWTINGSLVNTRAGVLVRNEGGTLRWRGTGRRTDTEGPNDINSSAVASLDVLTHVACVCRYDAGAIEIYVDGALSGSLAVASWTGNTDNTTSDAAVIGSHGDQVQEFFDGLIGDVRCYARALSSSEINHIWARRGGDAVIGAHRYGMKEGLLGGVASGAGSILDRWGSLDGTPSNSPVYAQHLARSRRRHY